MAAGAAGNRVLEESVFEAAAVVEGVAVLREMGVVDLRGVRVRADL